METSRGIVAAISLGSNLGDRRAHLAQAFVLLAGIPRTRLLVRSSIIETAPQPVTPQPVHAPAVAAAPVDLGGPYLNAAALVKTVLDAPSLAEELFRIERLGGRVRDRANQACPRTIDLDLLTFDSLVLSTPELTLPHPRMHARDFVLRPLAQIAPDLVVPGHNRTVRELLGLLDESLSGSKARP